MKILITGATGRVGRHVLEEVAPNADVTATTRATPPATALARRAECTWQQADLAAPTPWRALLDGVDAAFLFPAFGQTQHFIDAARDTGLPRLVLLSSGAAADLDDSFIKAAHVTIEQQAAHAGINTIRIRPTVFMSNDLAWVDSIRANDTIPLPYPSAAMPVIAEHDIAAAISSCLLVQPDRDTYHLTGPQSLTQVDRLEALSRHVTGRAASHRDATEQARQHGLPGMPPQAGEYLLRNLAAAAHTPARPTADFTELLGRAPMSYSGWLRRLTQDQ